MPYIDSGGLGQMVASYSAIKKTGGAVRLLNVGSRNQELLSMTRLSTLFDSFDDEAEAVQSFETIAPPVSPDSSAPALEPGETVHTPTVVPGR